MKVFNYFFTAALATVALASPIVDNNLEARQHIRCSPCVDNVRSCYPVNCYPGSTGCHAIPESCVTGCGPAPYQPSC